MAMDAWDGVIPVGIPIAGALIRDFADSALAHELRERNCPAVRIGRLPHPADRLLPAVLPDADAAGILAAEHLAQRGFHDLAFLSHANAEQSLTLAASFRRRTAELGCRYHSLQLLNLRATGETLSIRRQRTGEWISSLPRPVGVSVYSEMEASTLTVICSKLGVAVPDEVGMITFSENPYSMQSELALTPITSVDVDAETMGREAAHLLRRLMAGEAAPCLPIMVAPSGVTQRRSTDTMALSDPVAARVLRFIWDNLEYPIDVPTIAKAVGASRRSMERSFRRAVHRGVGEEIRRKRLEACAELLRTTDMTIAEISARFCFSATSCLHRDFKKAYNMTPRRYRLAARSTD